MRLARMAAAGDADALAELVRATQADVWRFVAHLAGPSLADDLTQETYLQALRSLPGFRYRSSVPAWCPRTPADVGAGTTSCVVAPASLGTCSPSP